MATKPILYFINLSPPVRSCILTARAIELDLELKQLNLLAGDRPDHRTEEFIKLNPQQTFPTLNDVGVCIWDSHAIVTYLVGKYGKDDSLYPNDLVVRAKIDQRLHFDNGMLFTRLRYFLEPIFFLNSPDIPEAKLKKMDEAYDVLETLLTTDLYMVGNNLTVADFCCVATVSTLNLIRPMNKERHSKVLSWMARCAELPYYYEANQKGADELFRFYTQKMIDNKTVADKFDKKNVIVYK